LIRPSMEARTISIGAGRYTDYALYSINGYYDANIYVMVTVDDLTLIGAGAENTIIVPETMHSEPPYGPIGICALSVVPGAQASRSDG